MNKLTPEEAEKRLRAAHDALGSEGGVDTATNAVMESARKALATLLLSFELINLEDDKIKD